MKYEPCDVLCNGINAFSSSQLDNYTRLRKRNLIEENILYLISISRLLHNSLQSIDIKNLAPEDIFAAKYLSKELKNLSYQVQEDFDMIDSLDGFIYIETAVDNIVKMKNRAETRLGEDRQNLEDIPSQGSAACPPSGPRSTKP